MSAIINAVFVAGIGLLGVVATGRLLRKQKTIASWPSVPGRLLEKTIVPVPGRYIYMRLAVRYAYDVGGITYEGTRIAPYTSDSRVRSVIQREFDAMPEAVTVHYDPARPADAYLTPGRTFWPRLAMAIGVLFLLIGGGLLLAV